VRHFVHVLSFPVQERDVVTNPDKALLDKSDFTQIAATMRVRGEELVQSLGVTSGMEILKLGCGDGTTAAPTAKLRANVLRVNLYVRFYDVTPF
jgi:cyclopropane fatty-acyl-phospholipid synthase-like methyltransferase